MRNYMNILCTILFYVCSSHAQTPLNDINGTNTIYSASEVDYRLASKVPTNRTITVGSQVGSLGTNLVFASTDTGVTESTVTNIAQVVVTSNVPTLAQVALSGGFAGTETIHPLNIALGGYFQSLGGAISGTIDQSSFGANQSGVNDGVMSIGIDAFGASQIGQNEGTRTIGDSATGSSQLGNNYGTQEIGFAAFGSSQSGVNDGVMSIGIDAFGASQAGYVSSFSTATNNAIGAMQIFKLSNGQHALTTPEGSASILLGAGTVSNKNSIVAGDGEYSHGVGSITAGGGFFGSGVGITGITPNQIGAASASNATLTGTATINGDVIIGSSAVTNAINAELSDIAPSIIRDIVTSTNVVRVTSTQSVYVATVASPCVITQDVSLLSLATNQTAFWTTRINVTDWSATNRITFATNIAAYAGDFTVTGCYDFACSLLCDGRIEMRQTFPTVYPWVKSPTSVAGVKNTADTCTFDRKTILGASDLSKTFVAEIPCVTCPYIVRALLYAGDPSAWATNVSVSAGLVWLGNGLEYGSALYTTNSISTNAITFKITQHYVPSISLQPTTAVRLYFNVSRPGLAGGFTFHPVEYRQANENEIKAFNAGWRP